MSNSHPTYERPTIIEAVCEVHFELPEDQPWKPSFVGDLFKSIQRHYPEMEPVTNLNLNFQLSPQGLQQRLTPVNQLMRFTHRDGLFLLQFASSVITLNVLKPYPGWNSVLREFSTVWRKVSGIVKPAAVTRVGLRYINLIDRDSADQTPGAWLQANEYIPSAILGSQPGFLMRTQVRLDSDNRVNVTLADVEAAEGGLSPIIIDIDRIVERNIRLEVKPLSAELTRLHEHIWQVFSSAQTEKLIKWMEGVDV